MSLVNTLKQTLLHQECHFTWSLEEDDFDLHDLVNRLEEQIRLETGKPRVTRAYNSLAFVRYMYNDFSAALTNLHKSEDLAKAYHGKDSDKFLIVTYGDLAWLFFHMERFDLCEEYLKRLERIRVKFSKESSNKINCEVLKEKGWAFLKFSKKYYNGATECFRRALEIDLNDSDLNAGYAIALFHTTSDPPDSRNSQTVDQLQRAIDLNSDNAILLMFLALRLLNNNQLCMSPKTAKRDHVQPIGTSEAISLVIRALEMSPENPHVMQYVAQFCRRLRSVDFAICQLEKMLGNTPNSAFIHHQLALCYKIKMMLLGVHSRLKPVETQQCLRQRKYHLKQAVSLHPSFTLALAELALHYGQISNIEEAEKLFQQAFQTAREKKENLQIVHALYGQFQLYSKRSTQLAIQHYMEGLRLQTSKRESQKCETELRKIVQFRFSKNPDDSKAWAIEGFINEMKDEKLKATECYQKALTYQKLAKEKDTPLITVLRIWLLGIQGEEKNARNLILGGHTHDVQAMCHGRIKILKGTMINKTMNVNVVEADLCNASKTLTREKSVLTPGPHAIVLAIFHHHGQFDSDTKKMLEDLKIFGESIWKHVIVLFTEGDTSIRNHIGAQGNVMQWLLQKCENRHYTTGIGSLANQSIEFSDRIMKMISKNNTMHLVIPKISDKKSPSFKMVVDSETEKSTLFTPEIITGKGQSVYRLLCHNAGWFQCKFTHLGFRMMGEGEVIYTTIEQDSSCPISTNHYAAGPLYDIKCGQGKLSELQFPHCEESLENCNFMTVAHYTGDNVEVLEPQSVSHTHVKVNVPGTSRFQIQNILNVFKSKIAGHIIIIYLPHPLHRLLIYLQPSNVDPHVIRDHVNGGKLILGTCKCTLEHGSKYKIVYSLLMDNAQPVTMTEKQTDVALFRRDCTYYYQDFEVQLPKEITKVILKLHLCRTDEEVWKYPLTTLKDYQNESTSTDGRQSFSCSGEQFIENHWAILVQKVSLVEPIADDLLSFIKNEKYSQVIAAETSQDKMRKLYSFLTTRKLKEKFYQSLQKHEPHLVEDLTNKSSH